MFEVNFGQVIFRMVLWIISAKKWSAQATAAPVFYFVDSGLDDLLTKIIRGCPRRAAKPVVNFFAGIAYIA